MPVTARASHLDVPLTNLTVKAFDGGASNIADSIFPVVSVGKRSDKYYTFTKQSWLTVPDTKRAPGSPSNRVTWDISSDSYYAEAYGLAAEYPVEDIANADASINFRNSTALQVAEKLARDRERRIARLISSGGNVGSGVTLSGDTLWSNYTNSDPIGTVNTGHAYIRNLTGMEADTMITNINVITIVRRHPDLLDMFKYTSGGALTNDQLAQVFGVQRILIGRGIVENALEGGTSSLTNIWPNNVTLCRAQPAAGLMTATVGLQFRWTNPELGTPFAVQRSRKDDAGSNHTEAVEARYYQDEKIIAPELGYVINTAI